MSIYFISDLHLEETRPDISRAFFSFLNEKKADMEQLYILGDFFENWIGDDERSTFQRAIMAAIRKLTDQGIPVYFTHGNRDFLIGAGFASETGCQLLEETSIIDVYGENVLIMHGDSLCTRDTGYMKFRKNARNPKWQQAFLSRPLEDRQTVARQLREISAAQNKGKKQEIMDVTPKEVIRELEKNKVQVLVHGHTHRPDIHSVSANEKPARRIVLGDWDTHIWYLQAIPNLSNDASDCSVEPVIYKLQHQPITDCPAIG